MKKSKFIALVLISSYLASCQRDEPKPYNIGGKNEGKKVHMRSDTTASYSRSHCYGSNGWLWYYAFRPYGYYNNVAYHRSGFYSSGIGENSNIGTSSHKSSATRGGFGKGHFSVSS